MPSLLEAINEIPGKIPSWEKPVVSDGLSRKPTLGMYPTISAIGKSIFHSRNLAKFYISNVMYSERRPC